MKYATRMLLCVIAVSKLQEFYWKFIHFSYFLRHRTLLHCVSKNVPPLTCYILYVHGSIATIFGTSIAEKVGN